MREIKFRAWDNREEKMEYPDGIANNIDGEKYQIMQYTGLKDKNGKDIYEGDVVEWLNTLDLADAPAQISIVGYDSSIAGYIPFCDYDSDCGVYVDKKTVIVIGNIHENPELVKGDK